jgi:hypothetical protein
MPVPFFTPHAEECSQCGHLRFRCVEVVDRVDAVGGPFDMRSGNGRQWALWRCDWCGFERTIAQRPSDTPARPVIC